MFFCEKFNFLLKLTIFSLLISVNDAVNNSDKKQDAKCLLPMEPGPCRMSLNRFYYNAQTDTCEEFKFGGCKGNDNKFGFKQTCEAACKKSTTTAAPGKTTVTSTTTKTPQYNNKKLNGDTLKSLTANVDASSTSTTTPKPMAARTTVKIKSSSTPRSGTTTTTTQKSNLIEMKSFIVVFVSMCCFMVAIQAAAVETVVAELEKDNNQNSETEAVLPTNEDCIQPKETGRCFALFYRFAFDVEKRECVEFIYGGCAGNSNNFETKEDCEQKCVLENKQDSDDKVLNTTVLPSSDLETVTEQVVVASS
ncbi:tissue factor pathway inhibitor [Calliphora vicina]|uniref:tissue factor pathway inhibitor n=1 Tax=Calliphora vicina TaxID=7373 RepID=UPI00325BD149